MNGPRHRSAIYCLGRVPGEVDGGRNRIVRRRERGDGLIGCSKVRRANGNPLQTALSRGAPAQVCEVMHWQVCGDFAEGQSSDAMRPPAGSSLTWSSRTPSGAAKPAIQVLTSSKRPFLRDL